ncbi:hypothetical protein CEXT_420571 [Caerostris extrusa]|uniref:Uncharacterized protein n=1 Tax=Caerostris extrusa TaxID=172846 RepID=A0AAV4T5Q2_CAEEX|nr:hypothetical protein CEXT_420571 [Caerostris extrusa]
MGSSNPVVKRPIGSSDKRNIFIHGRYKNPPHCPPDHLTGPPCSPPPFTYSGFSPGTGMASLQLRSQGIHSRKKGGGQTPIE